MPTSHGPHASTLPAPPDSPSPEEFRPSRKQLDEPVDVRERTLRAGDRVRSTTLYGGPVQHGVVEEVCSDKRIPNRVIIRLDGARLDGDAYAPIRIQGAAFLWEKGEPHPLDKLRAEPIPGCHKSSCPGEPGCTGCSR